MTSNRFAPRTWVDWALGFALLVIVTAGSGCGSKSSPTAPPTGPATLVVRSSPGAVPISIDGATPTNWTPSTLSLPAGNHTIGLKFLGYRDTTIAVSLSAASSDTLTVLLGPGPGTPRSFGTWLTLSGFPDDLAVGPDGPLYVTMGTSTRSLLAYSLAGVKLGEASLNPSGFLAVAANGDAYLSERLGIGAWVLSHFTSTASYSNAIYYGAGNWPGPPIAAMGTDDTLMVLLEAPTQGVVGTVYRHVNDQLVSLFEVGRHVGAMAVDRAARRCYFMSGSDSVHVYSTGATYITSWKCGLFQNQSGELTVAVDGTVYVADLSSIRHFTGDGALLGAWGVGDIGGVWGLAVDSQGRIYVAANGTKQIVRYVP